MTFHDLWRAARTRWRVVVAAVVVALGLSLGLSALETPQYSSSTQLFVSTSGSENTQAAYQGNLLSQQRVTSYAQLVTGQQVAQRVVDELGLSTSAAELAKKVAVSIVRDTVILEVSVTDSSPKQAQQLADAVSQQLSALVTELETPDGQTNASARLSIVQNATLPGGPVSPQPLRNGALGLLVGLLAGLGLAVLREQLDNTVKSGDEVGRVTGATTIGALPFDEHRSSVPMIEFSEGHSASAETFRQVRTNLQFLDVDHPPRSIVVTSAVPGEGKTTTAINLAAVLAEAGNRVALVEADLRRPRVARYLGLVEEVGLTNVLAGTADLEDVVQRTANDNVWLVAAGPHPPNPSELLGSTHMRTLLGRLAARYDYVVIDAPPLLPVTDAAVLTTVADGALVVARHGHTKRDQLARAVGNLAQVDGRVLGSILNMVPARGAGSGYEYAYYYETDPRPAVAGSQLASDVAERPTGPAPVEDHLDLPDDHRGRNGTPTSEPVDDVGHVGAEAESELGPRPRPQPVAVPGVSATWGTTNGHRVTPRNRRRA